MKTKVDRRTVDLSAYVDSVVIYLGMRVAREASRRAGQGSSDHRREHYS